MSHSHATSSSDASNAPLQQLESVLQQHVADGDQYIRARDIADELPDSSKVVGRQLSQLESNATTVNLERWSGQSNAILWRVTPCTE